MEVSSTVRMVMVVSVPAAWGVYLLQKLVVSVVSAGVLWEAMGGSCIRPSGVGSAVLANLPLKCSA